MELFTTISMGAAATFLLVLACIMETKNIKSAVAFKFFPAAIAFALLVAVLHHNGVIVATT